MELKVSVTEKLTPTTYNQALLQSHHNICVVSCENVVVFTRVLYRSNSFKQSFPVYTVYAADINSPFEKHVVLESLDQILKIKFSSDGHQLLIVTSFRLLHLFVKGSGLHQWTNTHTSSWCEEEIIFVDFFHTKNKPNIQINDIKVYALYSEKFQCRVHQPSLKSIGNCPQNGFFAVTASGLFLACTLDSNGVMEEEAKAVLGPVRDNFNLATAAFAQNGHIHLTAWKPHIVKCWEIELSYIEKGRISPSDTTNTKLNIRVVSSNFFAPVRLNSEIKNAAKVKVTHLKYADRDDPNSLLLFIEVEKEPTIGKERSSSEQQLQQNQTTNAKDESDKSDHSYLLQRYVIQDKTRTLFQFFLQSSSPEKPKATATVKEWCCVSEWSTSHPIVALNTPMHNLFSGFTIPYPITVASTDGTIHIINKDTMQQMSKFSFPPGSLDDPASGKRSPKERQIVSMATTWTNLHMVALDSAGGIHVLSVLKQSDIAPTWLVYIMLLLEYALVSGYDWLDILMATPPASAVTLAERLSETFHLHPAKIVANLLSKFLVLKNSILRVSSNSHQRSIEARLQSQLSAILKLFHSLRPVTLDVANGDKNLALSIQGFIESRNSLEVTDIDSSIDNLLFNCNILDCQIDTSFSQDLQILLEFSTDLALYLLLLLVQNPKYELAKEPKTLQYLREILFVSRLWFRHNKLVLPQMLKKNDSVDIWSQLYKLLTRLAQIIPNEPDAGFLDDCVNLETQVLCREVPLFIPPRGVIGCIANAPPSTSLFPLQFHYGQGDPNPPTSNVNPRPLEGSLASPQPLDPLYYQFLGTKGILLQCTRCFAMRGTWCGANGLSMWDQEWSTRCICSGHWALSNQHNATNAA